ncbi:uncharacterized protein TNCV_4910561 [Trichonephila clavipes]|nr:uncharacterized protein TNCV_4910561 [Trichonephila clavipes]
MIADQMKKRCSPQCKEHYLDIWEELISPEMLADKLEAFDNIRKYERPPKREYSHQVPNERSPLRYYGCGRQGVIKSSCPTCNPTSSQRTDVATNPITTLTRSPRLILIDITFCGIKERVCADPVSSHSIAGERMYQDGEATTILEHHINTGNSHHISVPPYRISPVKKKILRKAVPTYQPGEHVFVASHPLRKEEVQN